MSHDARRLLRLAPAALWAAAFILGPTTGRAGATPPAATAATAADARWSVRTRAFVSGGSFDSEPADYKAYSGIALEAGLRRALGPRWAAELIVHSESREVDRVHAGAEADRLGSLELLPVTLAVLWRPAMGRSLHPYAGAGVNLTVGWEKSGVLDSLDVSPHVGPALQLGVDADLGPRALVDVDVRWNTLRTEITDHGTRLTRLRIDPLTLAAGLGVRF